MVQGAVETEVKIRITHQQQILDRLHAEGFSVSTPRLFEANILYDRSDGPSLRSSGMLLRLRQAGETAVITWKGLAQPGPHKSRPELETSLGSLHTMQEIFGHLGFAPKFRYEKYRTEFRNAKGEGVVTVDETPIGDFLEIEGPSEWIDQVATQLGHSARDYVLDSYGSLYESYCKEHSIIPSHMVFPA